MLEEKKRGDNGNERAPCDECECAAELVQLRAENKRLRTLLVKHGIDASSTAADSPRQHQQKQAVEIATNTTTQATSSAPTSTTTTALLPSPVQYHANGGGDHELTNSEIARYGRQLILKRIGRPGQAMLKKARVLVVGAGGLGCPVGMYLAAAGIGTLGFVDDDEVDISNLHRQVLHTEDRVGVPKCESIIRSLKQLNSCVTYVAHKCRLMPDNAMAIFSQYDVIVDATDNAPSRYLISDTAVLLGLPLVSGSALRTDGQLTVYNYEGSPCYRCLFPVPPPASTVTNCSEGGVLGAVPGVIGCLQALEVIKLLTASTPSDKKGVMSGRFLMWDGEQGIFRTIKMRGRQPHCRACGDGGANGRLEAPMRDYAAFCHMDACDRVKGVAVLSADERITARALSNLLMPESQATASEEDAPSAVIDVRSEVEYGICRLPNTTNIPYTVLKKVDSRGFDDPTTGKAMTEKEKLLFDHVVAMRSRRSSGEEQNSKPHTVLLCRRGNDSQHAVRILEKLINAQDDSSSEKEAADASLETPPESQPPSSTSSTATAQPRDSERTDVRPRAQIVDVVGGLTAWTKTVDASFPIY